MINVLSFILLSWLFVQVFRGRNTQALIAIAFLIPINVFPFSRLDFPLHIGAYAIWTFWLAARLKGEWIQRNAQTLIKISPLVILIWMGVVFGLLNSGQIQRYDTFTKLEPVQQLINITAFLLTVIVFVRIFTGYVSEPAVRYKLMAAFSASSILHLASNVASFSFIRFFIPDFLISKPTITFESTFGIVIPRYAARLGSYEFVADFSLIVLAFSLINISRNQYRLLSWISIAASMIIGIMSGTRSLFIILAIFIVMLIFYQRKKLGSVLKYGVVGVIFIIIAMPFIISYFQNSPLFARILDTIYKYQTQGLVGASNRNFEAGFMSLINFGSIFGLGSYYLNTLGPSEIVSHNVLFAMYGKYGVYGLAFMLGLFYKAYSTSKKVLKFSPDESARNESAFFLALLFALFAQEMKYSFIRDMSSILVYALMFMTLFVFTRSEHRLEKGNPA